LVVQGGEDKSIDGMIARLLAPGDCLSLAPEELFLCARVCVVGLISTRPLLFSLTFFNLSALIAFRHTHTHTHTHTEHTHTHTHTQKRVFS